MIRDSGTFLGHPVHEVRVRRVKTIDRSPNSFIHANHRHRC